MLLPAACLAYCAWIPDLTSALAYILINIGTAASALTTAAVSCNHFDISPRNAGEFRYYFVAAATCQV